MKEQARLEHGGSLLVGKRRVRRPLSLEKSHHLVLKSDFAYGARSLLRHRPLIKYIIKRTARRFEIKILGRAIVGNHIHLLVVGNRRDQLQNFFRVVAGHIAQKILKKVPLNRYERMKRSAEANGLRRKTRERENKFWQTRVYSRVVRWSFDFVNVWRYIIQNELEVARIIPYKTRKKLEKWRESA